jgi:hypothetical protein
MIRVLAWIDRRAGWLLVAALLVAGLLVLAGCGSPEARPPAPAPAPGPLATLASLGATLTWAGGICAAGGVALSLVALVWPPLGLVAGILRFAAVGGSGVLATGVAVQSLANPWVLGLAIVAIVGVVGWLHRNDVRRVLARRMDCHARAKVTP